MFGWDSLWVPELVCEGQQGSREAVYGLGSMRGHGEYTELSPHVRS